MILTLLIWSRIVIQTKYEYKKFWLSCLLVKRGDNRAISCLASSLSTAHYLSYWSWHVTLRIISLAGIGKFNFLASLWDHILYWALGGVAMHLAAAAAIFFKGSIAVMCRDKQVRQFLISFWQNGWSYLHLILRIVWLYAV